MHRPLCACVFALLASTAADAGHWPQWRGPTNDGHSPEKGIPSEWGPEKNVVWKFALPGIGSSTPCIWGDKIFLTCQDGTDGLVICLGTDGKEKWRQKLGTGKVATRGDEGGNLATASPSTDGKLVYVFMGSGEVAAFDFEGKKVWQYNTLEKYGPYAIQFGAHWTPVLHKGTLYACVMHRNAQVILALDAATGKLKWASDRFSDSPKGTESPDVYSSPFIWENGDKALLIVHGNDYCTAHNLADGSEVWRVGELNPKANYNRAWRAVASPLVTPDLIVVPSCKKGVIVGIDPNKAKGLIQPGSPGELWRIAKNSTDVPSPLLVGDILYVFREASTIDAYDAKTGTFLYSEKVTEGRNRGNPLFVDGKIVLVGRDGTQAVVKPGKEFELISKNKLPDTFTSSPAAADGRLYLRGWNHLWAIGTK